MKGIKHTTFVALAGGCEMEVRGYTHSDAPGLIVHRRLTSKTKLLEAAGHDWTVSHLRSGRSVIRGFPSRTAAVEGAIALTGHLTWDTTNKQLMRRKTAVRTAIAAVKLAYL